MGGWRVGKSLCFYFKALCSPVSPLLIVTLHRKVGGFFVLFCFAPHHPWASLEKQICFCNSYISLKTRCNESVRPLLTGWQCCSPAKFILFSKPCHIKLTTTNKISLYVTTVQIQNKIQLVFVALEISSWASSL